MGDNANRFLNAFYTIERLLRKKTGKDNSTSFHELVREAVSHDSVVRRYRDDLFDYGDLRNAIVHQRKDGRPIADPIDAAVKELETIARNLERVPGILNGRRAPLTFPPEKRVSDAAREMAVRGFSQVPVYDEQRYRGLLSANTITRWLGARLEHDLGLLEDKPIEDALTFAENPKQELVFVPRTATVVDALDLFIRASQEGRALQALLVAEHGLQDEIPLGIVTVSDIPGLLAAIDA